MRRWAKLAAEVTCALSTNPHPLQAPVVYFRAATEGACTYMDDRRDARLPHGACWYDLCDDLEVLDIPGDHFSILRQVGGWWEKDR